MCTNRHKKCVFLLSFRSFFYLSQTNGTHIDRKSNLRLDVGFIIDPNFAVPFLFLLGWEKGKSFQHSKHRHQQLVVSNEMLCFVVLWACLSVPLTNEHTNEGDVTVSRLQLESAEIEDLKTWSFNPASSARFHIWVRQSEIYDGIDFYSLWWFEVRAVLFLFVQWNVYFRW